MNPNNKFDKMRGIFPLSKTIAFQLIPIGKTQEHLTAKNTTENAEVLAEDYKNLKGAADRVHKRFIEETLKKFHLKYLSDGEQDSIQEYAEIYLDPSVGSDEKDYLLNEIIENLKAQVSKAFENAEFTENQQMLEALASQNLLKKILPAEQLTEEERTSLGRLQKYTSYMRPYFTMRDRIYRADEKGHTIPVRIVEDNLPIHLSNVHTFLSLPTEVVDGAYDIFNLIAPFLQAYNLEDVFTPSFYSTLCPQSAIDAYNQLIGGVSNEDNTRVQGLNELINQYNQAHEDKQIKPLKKLMKQILTDRESLSWIPAEIVNDEEVISAIVNLHETVTEKFRAPENTDWDPSRVYVKADRLNDYSHAMFGDWSLASLALKEEFVKKSLPRKKKESEKKYSERLDKLFKTYKNFSLSKIHRSIREYSADDTEKEIPEASPALRLYFMNRILEKHNAALADYNALKEHVHDGKPDSKLGQDPKDGTLGAGALVKSTLDNLIEAKNAANIFTDHNGTLAVDPGFYTDVVEPYEEIASTLIPVYNSVRNYLTKKPYSDKKVQLYFDTPDLMKGWDINKETINRAVIIREDETLYLGILPEHAKRLFSSDASNDEGSTLKKMDVKFIPNPHMQLPHVAFSRKALASGNIPSEVLRLRESGKEVKNYDRDEVAMMIDFYKNVIKSNHDWDVFGFEFKETGEYGRLADFFTDVEKQSYRTVYHGISRDFVEKAVEAGNLYLFKISCQDMLEKHHGKDGDYKILLYEALSGKKDCDVRLCGGGAIYHRKASLKPRVTHPAGIPIENKNPNSKNRTRTFKYDIIKDRRYTVDRYMFHVPVEIFPTADKRGGNRVNDKVKEIIKANPDMYVLGINRGERNLISMSVTAPDGTIVEQRNLNVFDNFDYCRKLADREKERNENRKNWTSVKEIKNLKAGYLSRVVGEIAKLVRKYGCVVAMERLEKEFKNKRRKFEKNVYEQFERDLVSKLSFLMDKDVKDGRIKTTVQLSNPGSTETERTKYTQNGIIFFMNPSWVSKTDPLTGFVNRLNTRHKSVKDAEAFLSSLDGFKYNGKTGRFEITFHYDKAAPDKETGDGERVWKIETYGERIEQIYDKSENPKGVWKDVTVNLTDKMKSLLESQGIGYSDSSDILETITSTMTGKKKAGEFYKELLHLIYLTLQNTNWNSETKEYRVIGCTADSTGKFFDSRTAPERMPKDGDTLAAWNIARKAHMALKNIREFVPGETLDMEGKKAKTPHLAVYDQEWFTEVQK